MRPSEDFPQDLCVKEEDVQGEEGKEKDSREEEYQGPVQEMLKRLQPRGDVYNPH